MSRTPLRCSKLAYLAAGVGLAFKVATLPLVAQGTGEGLPAIGNPHVRVVFPSHDLIDTMRANLLIGVVESARYIPGLSIDVFSGGRITLSLAAQAVPGVDGRATPMRRLIVIPLVESTAWDRAKVNRVIRHELAHVALSTFLGFRELEPWLDEGFAEWASGGLTCEGETRIRLDLMRLMQLRKPLPRITSGGRRSRLMYDYYATFLEFLDRETRGSLTDGTVLSGIKSGDLERGIAEATHKSLPELEEAWRNDLLARYQGLPEGWSCNATDIAATTVAGPRPAGRR